MCCVCVRFCIDVLLVFARMCSKLFVVNVVDGDVVVAGAVS